MSAPAGAETESGLRVVAAEVLSVALRLTHPLATSRGEHGERPIVLVRLETDRGIGVGECSALAEPTYTSEYAAGAAAVLEAHLLPRLLAAGEQRDVGSALASLEAVRGHRMAKAAVEMALLDAELRAEGRSLAGELGATSDRVGAGANVSMGSPDAVCEAIEEARTAGYRRVKVKIAPGSDLEVLRAAIEAFPDLELAADANGAYDLDDPDHLRVLLGLDDLGLTYLEQPLAPDALAASERLCKLLELPVILDESVEDMAGLERACLHRALDGCSVKPARVGGLLAAKALLERCRTLGLSAVIGGMLESGIGRAAALALAACPGFDLPGDLGASERYFVPDLTAPHVLEHGQLAVPRGPGIGVELDERVLEEHLVRRVRLL